MVNSTLKIPKGISVECMECLNKDAKKKKKYSSCTSGIEILYIVVKDDQITTSSKLHIAHNSYGFSGDLIGIDH